MPQRVPLPRDPYASRFLCPHDPHVTIEYRATGPDVERISAVHYLGHTYEATTKAEGVGVAIAFFVLSALFLALGIRRLVVTRRELGCKLRSTGTIRSGHGGVAWRAIDLGGWLL